MHCDGQRGSRMPEPVKRSGDQDRTTAPNRAVTKASYINPRSAKLIDAAPATTK